MKICIQCKEPKFKFQMEKFTYYSAIGGSFTERLKVCKKCFKEYIYMSRYKMWGGDYKLLDNK
jgi:hypothetical protein